MLETLSDKREAAVEAIGLHFPEGCDVDGLLDEYSENDDFVRRYLWRQLGRTKNIRLVNVAEQEDAADVAPWPEELQPNMSLKGWKFVPDKFLALAATQASGEIRLSDDDAEKELIFLCLIGRAKGVGVDRATISRQLLGRFGLTQGALDKCVTKFLLMGRIAKVSGAPCLLFVLSQYSSLDRRHVQVDTNFIWRKVYMEFNSSQFRDEVYIRTIQDSLRLTDDSMDRVCQFIAEKDMGLRQYGKREYGTRVGDVLRVIDPTKEIRESTRENFTEERRLRQYTFKRSESAGLITQILASVASRGREQGMLVNEIGETYRLYQRYVKFLADKLVTAGILAQEGTQQGRSHTVSKYTIAQGDALAAPDRGNTTQERRLNLVLDRIRRDGFLLDGQIAGICGICAEIAESERAGDHYTGYCDKASVIRLLEKLLDQDMIKLFKVVARRPRGKTREVQHCFVERETPNPELRRKLAKYECDLRFQNHQSTFQEPSHAAVSENVPPSIEFNHSDRILMRTRDIHYRLLLHEVRNPEYEYDCINVLQLMSVKMFFECFGFPPGPDGVEKEVYHKIQQGVESGKNIMSFFKEHGNIMNSLLAKGQNPWYTEPLERSFALLVDLGILTRNQRDAQHIEKYYTLTNRASIPVNMGSEGRRQYLTFDWVGQSKIKRTAMARAFYFVVEKYFRGLGDYKDQDLIREYPELQAPDQWEKCRAEVPHLRKSKRSIGAEPNISSFSKKLRVGAIVGVSAPAAAASRTKKSRKAMPATPRGTTEYSATPVSSAPEGRRVRPVSLATPINSATLATKLNLLGAAPAWLVSAAARAWTQLLTLGSNSTPEDVKTSLNRFSHIHWGFRDIMGHALCSIVDEGFASVTDQFNLDYALESGILLGITFNRQRYYPSELEILSDSGYHADFSSQFKSAEDRILNGDGEIGEDDVYTEDYLCCPATPASCELPGEVAAFFLCAADDGGVMQQLGVRIDGDKLGNIVANERFADFSSIQLVQRRMQGLARPTNIMPLLDPPRVLTKRASADVVKQIADKRAEGVTLQDFDDLDDDEFDRVTATLLNSKEIVQVCSKDTRRWVHKGSCAIWTTEGEPTYMWTNLRGGVQTDVLKSLGIQAIAHLVSHPGKTSREMLTGIQNLQPHITMGDLDALMSTLEDKRLVTSEFVEGERGFPEKTFSSTPRSLVRAPRVLSQ